MFNCIGPGRYVSVRKRVFLNSVFSVLALCTFFSHSSYAAAPLPYVGDVKTHVATTDDTMPDLARKNDIGYDNLRSANPYTDPWMLGSGTKLVIPTRHILPDEAPRKGIVINLPELRLYLFAASGELAQTHPIGEGREGLMTPVGHTTVVRKVVGPIWRPTPRMLKENPDLPAVVGPGPDNPMGTNALYLGWPQYAIHGTDKPYAIGRRASSGCIRMYPEDILRLYPAVPVGEAVTVVNEPVKAAWIDGKMYVEAHPPLDQAMMIEEEGGHPYYDMTNDDMAEILRVAGNRVDQIDWSKLRDIIRNREGYPVAVTEEAGKDENDQNADDQSAATAEDINHSPKADIPKPDDTLSNKENVSAPSPKMNKQAKASHAAPKQEEHAAPVLVPAEDDNDQPATPARKSTDGPNNESESYNGDG